MVSLSRDLCYPVLNIEARDSPDKRSGGWGTRNAYEMCVRWPWNAYEMYARYTWDAYDVYVGCTWNACEMRER